MKRNTLKPETAMGRNLIAALMITLLLISGSIFAQTNNAKESKKKMNAIENLVKGIESDNNGLSRSSVYYAGLYRIQETVEPLMEKMRNENDPSTRVLIALALFRIGDPEGMEMIESLASKDPDAKVRRMMSAIYNEYTSPEFKGYVGK